MEQQNSNTSDKGRILIVGGGPAGSATAFWLARAGFKVTVAEQSTCHPYGQGIDVQDEAVEVVRRMGLLEDLKAHTTGETGFALLDDEGVELASIGANSLEKKDALSPTNELEIMRGTLTTILADAAKKLGVEYRYGCTVTSVDQTPSSVSVMLSDSDVRETFTSIIGADGIGSKLRQLTFPESITKSCYKETSTHVAFFSMPNPFPSSSINISRLQHAPFGRAIWLRPIDRDGKSVSCYLNMTSTSSSLLQDATSTKSSDTQKSILTTLFSDVPGIAPAAVVGMNKSEDFYFARLTQLKLPTWHSGRVALVGDSAYAPTPLCGGGNTLAILGAYVLAGELSRCPENPERAFEMYHKKLHEYVKKAQEIPLWGYAPNIFMPQTRWGIWMLRTVFWGVCSGPVQSMIKGLSAWGDGEGQKGMKGRLELERYGFEVE